MRGQRSSFPAGRAARQETLTPQGQAREFRRVLRRLAEPAARLAPSNAGFDLFVRKNSHAKPVLRVAKAVGEALIAEGLVKTPAETASFVVITEEGHAYLRRAEARAQAEAADAQPFAAQHRSPGRRYVGEEDGRGAVHNVNLAESPLTWLASRTGPDGAPLLLPAHVEAGERLREDHTRAGLMQRVTVDWQWPMTGGAQGGDRGLSLSEVALAARQRVQGALLAVGPEFEDVLLTVCCHLRGLEEVERTLGWPPRSGKIVLKIALGRLARHYGIIRIETKRTVRAWQS